MGFTHGNYVHSRHEEAFHLTSIIVSAVLFFSYGVTPSTCYYIPDVQWIVGAQVSEYSSYSSVNLLTLKIPSHTEEIFWTFRAFSTTSDCDERNVTVVFQPGGYPIVTPNNETFPDNFYIDQTRNLEFVFPSSNKTFDGSVLRPRSGLWYAAVFMQKYSGDVITPKIFRKSCTYLFSMITIAKVIEGVVELSMENSQVIQLGLNSSLLYKYTVPDYTVEYTVEVSNCQLTNGDVTEDVSPCPISLQLSEEVTPSSDSITVNCSVHNDTCMIQILSPSVLKTSYIRAVRHDSVPRTTSVSFTLSFSSLECKRAEKMVIIEHINSSDSSINLNRPFVPEQLAKGASCISANSLGRFKIAPKDFTGSFLLHNIGDLPYRVNEIVVSDVHSVSTDFYIDPKEDMGGTLKIGLSVVMSDANTDQGSQIWMCLMKNRVPYKQKLLDCPDGALLTVNTSSRDSAHRHIYVPYPQSGQWYLSLQSACFNRSTADPEKCVAAPMAEFLVMLSPCIEEECGRYGECKEYISGVHIYSSCLCYAKYQGYDCTDGTDANSDAVELASTLLLSLSNLFFIPGIIVSLRRRFYTEALVYAFNMFLSTFYHACDSSKVYIYCLLKYDTLSYGDFMASIMSFWMTLMAMAKLHPQLRSFMHMLGALLIALLMEYDRLGFWETVVPIIVAAVTVLISWIIVWRKRRHCFPSKRRYLKFLLPGFLLAALGMFIYAFLETSDNYMYTHSSWHVLMALSIIFLLPPKRVEKKEQINDVRREDSPTTERRGLLANMSDAGSVGSVESLRIINGNYRNTTRDNLLL